jgi:hypothetical protein
VFEQHRQQEAVRVDHGRHRASAAPTSNDPAAKNPQKAAASTPGV